MSSIFWIIIDTPVQSALVQIKLGTLFYAVRAILTSPIWSSG